MGGTTPVDTFGGLICIGFTPSGGADIEFAGTDIGFAPIGGIDIGFKFLGSGVIVGGIAFIGGPDIKFGAIPPIEGLAGRICTGIVIPLAPKEGGGRT